MSTPQPTSRPTTGTVIQSAPTPVYPDWVDLIFPERKTQQYLQQTNTLLAQMLAAQGVRPQTRGLASPVVIGTGSTVLAGTTAAGATESTALPPLLTQRVTPAALVATLLAAEASGFATFEIQSAASRIAPRGQGQFLYRVPTGQILVLLNPLTASADLHAATVTVSVAIDTVAILKDWALTTDAGVLLAAESTIRQQVLVTYSNGEWDDVDVTTVLTGVLVNLDQYTTEFAPLIRAIYQGLAAQAASVASHVPVGPLS